MATDAAYAVTPAEADAEPHWFDRLAWAVLIALAWLVFEVTANATLSILLACLKFGMNDVRTAWWLWREDPRRGRARACAAFYLASAVWKTAIVPLLTAGTIAVGWALISARAMHPADPMTASVLSAMQVGIAAALLLVLMVTVAAVASLAARWRVWVSSELHRARRIGDWPPVLSSNKRRYDNLARPIVMTALFVAILIAPAFTLFLVLMLRLPPPLGLVTLLMVVFGYPILAVLALRVVRSKVIADSAWECWPESLQQVVDNREDNDP